MPSISHDDVRKAAVAGTWYPGTAAALAAAVDGIWRPPMRTASRFTAIWSR